METTAMFIRIRPVECLIDDVSRMMVIEQDSFLLPWTLEDFDKALLKTRNASCALLEIVEEIVEESVGTPCKRTEKQIVGFLIYQTEKSMFDVWNMAVDSKCRRRGHGKMLIDYLKGRLSRGRREKIRVLISESNLLGQMFLRSQGFRCEEILHGYWNDGTDAYSMEYHELGVPRNRLLQYGGFSSAADV